jgi:hypothetical protein
MSMPLIAFSGIISFILFIAAIITGIRRMRLLRYHKAAGIVCCIAAIFHGIHAFSVHMIDPLGLLAGMFMVCTYACGYRVKKRFRLHIVLTSCTMFFVIAHVLLMLYVN